MVALADAVSHDVIKLAREIDRAAVRQMTAVCQVHGEIRIARLHHGEIHRHVGLRAGVRLHVGVLAAEESASPLAGQLFHAVDEFAAAVVPPARIAFGILVGEDGAGRFEHGGARIVFRSDQLEPRFLAAPFQLDRRPNFRVRPFQRRHSYLLGLSPAGGIQQIQIAATYCRRGAGLTQMTAAGGATQSAGGGVCSPSTSAKAVSRCRPALIRRPTRRPSPAPPACRGNGSRLPARWPR